MILRSKLLLVLALTIPIPAAAAWSGFTDQSATLGTNTFSFVGSNPEAGDSNENYYDGDFADFDGDGWLDRALISRYGLLLNTGGGVMTPMARTVTGGTYLFGDGDAIGNDAVEWADVDGDDDPDSIQGGNGEALKLQINRRSRFNIKWSKSSTAKRIVGIDIERDGDVDLVVSGCFCLTRNCSQPDGFKLWVNDGAGNFSDETAARGLAYGTKLVGAVIAGDIDRDGDFDLVMASGDTTGAGAPAGTSMKMLAMKNNGAGVFSEQAFYDIPAAVADVDTWGAGIGMNGNTNVDLGDIDGDGDLDFLASALGPMGSHPSVYYPLFINDGSGGFSEQAALRFDVGTYDGVLFATRIKLVDVDHDNDFDIVAYEQGDATAYNLQGHNLQLFLNDGAGNFTFEPDTFGPMAPIAAGIMSFDVADYTGDGVPDLWVGQGGGPVLNYVNSYSDVSGIAADIPRALRVIATTGGVTLGWKAPPFASTVRAYRVYRSSTPGLPTIDRELIKRVGITRHGDESLIAPLNPTTTTVELGDATVTIAGDGEVRYRDTSATPGVTYFYSVTHIGNETKASQPTLEVSAALAAPAGSDTAGPDLVILSPSTQDWSGFARVVLQYGDQSGIDLATLNVSFDKDLGVPASGGRVAGSNVADVFLRKDSRSYLAAFTSALKLPVGLVTMTASIRDLAGNLTTRQVTFNVEVVEAQLPTAAASASVNNGAAPLPVSFDASASTDSDGKVVRWEWYFGDGGVAIGRQAAHTYSYGGSFSAILVARDNEGGVATVTVPVTVTGGAAACTGGESRACYSGDPSTQGVGVCASGTQVCIAGAWSACSGETMPTAELCDGSDNDCDGTPDEDWPTLGFACVGGLGVCAGAGVWVCSGNVAVCSGSAGSAQSEICGNNLDENCDGTADDGCPCTAGSRRVCYGGPNGTQGLGACVPGSQNCVAGAWGSCSGQTTPSDEVCADRADNDCDGLTDSADDCTVSSDDPSGGTVNSGCAASESDSSAAPWALAVVMGLVVRFGRKRLSKA